MGADHVRRRLALLAGAKALLDQVPFPERQFDVHVKGGEVMRVPDDLLAKEVPINVFDLRMMLYRMIEKTQDELHGLERADPHTEDVADE